MTKVYGYNSCGVDTDQGYKENYLEFNITALFALCPMLFVYNQTNYTQYGPRREKTCLWGFANNKGSYQPAHPRRLISAFVIRLLDSFISKLASSEISIF